MFPLGLSIELTLDAGDSEDCVPARQVAIEAQLDEVLVVVQTDAVVRPHAVMVHQQHTLVAHAAVMRPQGFQVMALLAEKAFVFGKLRDNTLKSFQILHSNNTIPANFGDIGRVPRLQVDI